jgi:hypothetical protein
MLSCMRTYLYLPTLFVALLGVFLFGITLPTGGPALAEEGEEEGGEDDPGEFYDEETSFSGTQVSKAIDKGVAWLRKKQGRNGSWGPMKGNSTYGGGDGGGEVNPAGPTALALYALLKCKQPMNDPVIKRGFAWLWDNYKKPGDSYQTSMLLLAVTATADQAKTSKFAKKLPKPKLTGRYRGWANKLANNLVDRRVARGWRYNHKSQDAAPGGPEDLSSTQLAALALHAADRCGIRVKNKVWEDILSYSLEQQEEDGPEISYKDPVDPKLNRSARARGFAYIKGLEDPDEGQATGGMTACGIANIEMARFALTDAGRKREQWDKRPDAKRVQDSLYDGIAWLEKHWSPFDNPKKQRSNVYHVYWLYAVERAMDLLSLRLLGSHNWYNEMGQELLNRQASDGHWDTKTSLDPSDTVDTAFALLFLKRATKGSIPFGSVTGGSDEPPADIR